MHVDRPTPSEHAEFRDLVDAEIRPGAAGTRAWDDFPLILAAENRGNTLVIRRPEGGVGAGISWLIRTSRTSCGDIPVAGIGSVVTRPTCRGQGMSRVLQEQALACLRRQNLPLAVLWTDNPAVYAGRGFVAAGWEHHVDLRAARLPDAPGPGCGIRPYRPQDAGAVQALYENHPYRTARLPGDGARLYGMPGTRGLVLQDGGGAVAAAVFCGKGADFPGYVTEWSGPPDLVLPLLGRAAGEGLAHAMLCPAGTAAMVRTLAELGAAVSARCSGLWAVLDARALGRACGRAPADGREPAAWLGDVAADGRIRPGLIDVAVWGFDSV